MKIETIAAQSSHHVDAGSGGITAPIQLSTTFEREADGTYPRGYVYSRNNNPNREALERCLRELEVGEAAAAFASGSAATAAIFQSLARQGVFDTYVVRAQISVTSHPTACLTRPCSLTTYVSKTPWRARNCPS